MAYYPSRDSKQLQTNYPAYVTKQHTSPLTTGDVFTFTGTLQLILIIGKVTTVIQAQATTVKLGIISDAFSAYDICATKDINGFTAGSHLSITGTAANAMVGTTSQGALAPGQANSITLTCVTSGSIKATYGAASTGAILWTALWRPLSSDATLVAA